MDISQKKLKAKKTQAEKNSSKISKKLQQIIQNLNILPTGIKVFLQKAHDEIDFSLRILQNEGFFSYLSLKSGKI